jgi:predicted RNA-binding protein
MLDGDSVIFTDLLENDTRIQGRLVSADLVNGKVMIDTDTDIQEAHRKRSRNT